MICPQCDKQFDAENATERDGIYYCPVDGVCLIPNEEPKDSELLHVDLTVNTHKTEEFIDELEKLCEKFSNNNDYYFKFE